MCSTCGCSDGAETRLTVFPNEQIMEPATIIITTSRTIITA